jgi:hypothetical protein
MQATGLPAGSFSSRSGSRSGERRVRPKGEPEPEGALDSSPASPLVLIPVVFTIR